MRDILPILEAWRSQGEQIAVATVIETWGSSPRPVGSKLAVTLSGLIEGSVSAGCVENAVIEEARASIQSGRPRLLRYGVSSEQALDVGLTCGGTIKVFVEPFTAFAGIFDLVKARLDAREPACIVSVLDGPPESLNRKLAVFADGGTAGDLALPGLQERLVGCAMDRLSGQPGGPVELEGIQLFIDVHPRVPRLVIVGAVHIAEFLAPMATLAGYDVTLVDPRTAFATPERFPNVSAILTRWPDEALASLNLDEASFVAVLSHDPKLDDPALLAALPSRARYVGVLGSKRAHAQRLERLRKAGLPEHQLARLHAPIGLPLGGRSAVEIAISILAEVVQARNA
jgi:xanthine dehydrogenase accessory factor